MVVVSSVPAAPYASDPAHSRGRLVDEPASRSRSAFRRDCDRVIHSTAFRRLKHKTQVFVFHEGDHYRTRLTHTLEVAQIARAIARRLGLDEDLTETLALAHDLGHPPFGHAGERALHECLAQHGGFDHNAQTLRVVTRLEHRYPAFNGLNLTWETLEGIVKHNGPLTGPHAAEKTLARGMPWGIAEFIREWDLEVGTFPGLEAQVAAIADDIAYDAHDIDDGLRAGLFDLSDMGGVVLVGGLIDAIGERYPGLDPGRQGAELVRDLISTLIDDVIDETQRRLAEVSPASVEDVRGSAAPLAGFSAAVTRQEGAIKAFLWQRMYRHERVVRIMQDAEAVVRDLFRHYEAHPGDIPSDGWIDQNDGSASGLARRIGDFIGGMTDRFALSEHARLFDSTPELR
jgi:dGTPase